MRANLWDCLAEPPKYPALARAAMLCSAGYTLAGPTDLPGEPTVLIEGAITQYPRTYVWNENGYRVVLVNGTANPLAQGGDQWAGWLVGANSPTGAQVNAFYASYGRELLSLLGNGRTLFIGHSMGGAMAHECAIVFRARDQSSTYAAVAFGAPGLAFNFGPTGVPLDLHVNVYRPTDPIQWLPGEIIPGINFRTVGRVYDLNDQGRLSAARQPNATNYYQAIAVVADVGWGGHSTANYFRALAIHIPPRDNPSPINPYYDP